MYLEHVNIWFSFFNDSMKFILSSWASITVSGLSLPGDQILRLPSKWPDKKLLSSKFILKVVHVDTQEY